MSAMILTTFTGRRIDPDNLTIHDIRIEDIAHALAHLCRFGGHSRQFYCVAQHSVRVAQMVDSYWRMQGLLHDATEYLVQDLVRPVKRNPLLAGYVELETRIHRLIMMKFDLDDGLHESVKYADNAVLRSEIEQFSSNPEEELKLPFWDKYVGPGPVKNVWSPYEAEQNFLRAFYWLDAYRRGYGHSDHLEELK